MNSTTTKRPLFTAIDDVKYTIEIIDPHTCLIVDTLQVLVLKKPGLYLPSGFTPNGDGLNDIVKPYLVRMKDLKRFTIFNRNGNTVFSTTKQGEGWNGMYQGKPADVGVYVWMIEYTTADNQLKMEKGTITLVR